ncbi:efflux RND transporter permease subunit [Anaerobacillus sp. HL2]|nr:efflux RND transporter permease subunit [Anaerobacillus sp. HL2]
MTTVVVFLPIVFVEGLASMIFRPLAYTVATPFTCIISRFVDISPNAFVKNVNKCKVDLKEKIIEALIRILNVIKDQYGSLLAKALKFRKTVVGISFAAVVGSIGLVPFIGFELFSLR